MVAALTRRFGDLDIAEEAAAEAFATAVTRWPLDGVPPNPGAWLTTTANRKAIDRIRRENKREDKQNEAQMLYDDGPPEPQGAIEDDRLRLIFTCCHPALAMETRVALTLRMVGGLSVPEIARAFLVQETAMEKRITRAKAKIKQARIPYRLPYAEDLPARVSGVLAVLFLVFNEGYLATGPDTEPVRRDLTAEAIRLTRLIRTLMPEDGLVLEPGSRDVRNPHRTVAGAAKTCQIASGVHCHANLVDLTRQGGSTERRCLIWALPERRSTITRSTRRGRRSRPSSDSRVPASPARARYRRPTLRRSTRSSGSPKADVRRLRTSTTTRVRGGPGSTARMSISSRPTFRLRTTTRHPSAVTYARGGFLAGGASPLSVCPHTGTLAGGAYRPLTRRSGPGPFRARASA